MKKLSRVQEIHLRIISNVFMDQEEFHYDNIIIIVTKNK